MQLHECLLLAVYSPPTVPVGNLAAGASEEIGCHDASDSELPMGYSSEQQQQRHGSILLMVQCIISEWGSNAQTNFYIPPEHYNNNAALIGCSTSSLLSIDDFKSSSFNDAAAAAATQSIMTCSPYIHPQLNLPVPQIQLPLYYGVLCWSFTLAGAIMLTLPPKWTMQLDGKTRHWFPYRIFAWILILWQVSLSPRQYYLLPTTSILIEATSNKYPDYICIFPPTESMLLSC